MMQQIKSLGDNICGECTACCTVLGVQALKKKSQTRCQHECEKGCAIYNERPTECQTYRCIYHMHPTDINLRPDKLGVVMDTTQTPLGTALVVREYRIGASEEPHVKACILNIANALDAYVYLMRQDNRSILLPENKKHLAPKVKEIIAAGLLKERGIEDE